MPKSHLVAVGIYREAEEDDGRGRVKVCLRRRGRVVRWVVESWNGIR